jgi:hypothetical protein
MEYPAGLSNRSKRKLATQAFRADSKKRKMDQQANLRITIASTSLTIPTSILSSLNSRWEWEGEERGLEGRG